MSKPSPASGLARFINATGGLNLDDAARRADLRLEWMKEHALCQIDEVIRRLITEAGAPRSENPQPSDLRPLAYELAGAGAQFGLPLIGQAAHSLCELLDLFETYEFWDRIAVSVHVEAIALLRKGVHPTEQSRILHGLQQVVDHYRKGAT